MATPVKLNPKQWVALAGSFGVLALLVMMWRWGGTVEDSQAYFDTARYLRGEVPASALRAPFPYRLLAPAVAAAIPGDTRNSFALLNWLCISVSAIMMALTVLRVGASRKAALIAGLLMILAVPTYWYAPYLLTDPASICARAAFVLAVVSGQPWLAALAGVTASAVREENILLLVWLLAMRRISIPAGLLALAVAGAWMVAVRWWLIPGLPSYVWAPSVQTLIAALKDVRSLASIASAIGLVLPLALLGMLTRTTAAPTLQALAQLKPLKSLLVLMALPPLYAALCVRVEGRAVWGLYPMLVPFAAIYSAAWLTRRQTGVQE
ncbi:hypothetical protein GTP56_03775 [Duganella sp. FT134W]|uniref:DUF2029 domain-containing protein n=1 Tax=Duganella margarita TaxID=2692170 RepID=A0A7X4GYC9_9BURK|nr:hypothetical protein [Duganella margarita]MYM71314.1 hypothetical protein [Duganella margarita]